MDAKNGYLNGDYKTAASAKTNVKTVSYKIGALVFTGQHRAARALFDEFSEVFSDEQQVQSNFHMALSYTRTSEYIRAQQFLLKNLRWARANSSGSEISNFYVYQGLSFFKFFFSKHKKSQRYAEKGYRHLMKMSSPPPLLLALSLDIQGHNLIQMGSIQRGLSSLKKAIEVCEEHDLKNLSSEISISRVIYQSDYELGIQEQIQKLENTLSSVQYENDYSRSELVLQISKLRFLSGQFQHAKEFLTSHYHLIYENENKRKIAKLNTLLAQILYQNGQFLEALSLTHVASQNLDASTDASLILPVLGVKAKILAQLGGDVSKEQEAIESVFQQVDRKTNKRIQMRAASSTLEPELTIEDPFGDLLDMVHVKKPEALDQIVKYGIWGLLPRYYKLKPGMRYLIVLGSIDFVVAIDSSGVHPLPAKFSKNQLKLLTTLLAGTSSKEILVKTVWGYNYDPLRHDPLIYSSIARIRKELGDFKDWLVADEEGYRIQAGISLVFPDQVKKPIKTSKINEPDFDSIELSYNHRQIQTIQKWPERFWSVSEYAEKWSVTRMTALRDLKKLVESGQATSVGRGKATRYQVLGMG